MDHYRKKVIISWAMYDWANSAFATTIMAGFFPIFFKQFFSYGADVTASTARLGLANSLAGICVALCAPILGAIADKGTCKKRFLISFATLGILMTSSLYIISQGSWCSAIAVYVLAVIGFCGANIFYDALITTVTSEKDMDFVSSLGFSLGYLGGGILFAINVWMTLNPGLFGFVHASDAVRFSFLTVGIWWAIFSIPLMLFVKEPENQRTHDSFSTIKAGLKQFYHTLREIRQLKTIFTFLLAYWLYIDGVDTIVRMAVDYGLSLGMESKDLIVALLITQFIGFPSAICFGYLGGIIGTKRAILITIGVYLFVSVWGALIQDKVDFFILAGIIGLVQGGIQALSRSFFAKIIPSDKSAEYFGFYNMIGKFATIIGPGLIAVVAVSIRSFGFSSMFASRMSIISITLLFLAGGIIFLFVDEHKGVKS